MTGQNAKVTIKQRGWSQMAAAKKLGVTFEHLNRVLNGHRESRRLLAAIAKIPMRESTRTANEN